jgi:hypothetical protein
MLILILKWVQLFKHSVDIDSQINSTVQTLCWSWFPNEFKCSNTMLILILKYLFSKDINHLQFLLSHVDVQWNLSKQILE